MLGSSVTLDLSEVIQQLKVPVIVSRVLINSGSQQLIEKLKVKFDTINQSMLNIVRDKIQSMSVFKSFGYRILDKKVVVKG